MPTPPFRADHVGSLLRSEAVTAARKAHFDDQSIDAEALKTIEDEHIRDVINRQESAGLRAVTDGETRET